MDQASLRKDLLSLLTSQKLAVLASYGDNQPYCSLMAFAVSEDLTYLIVATKRHTRKFANIQAHPRVSLLVDNRRNQADDFQQAVAVTVLATATEVKPAEREQCLNLYLFKHPYMRSFCQAPDCALLKLTVDRYLVVTSFRNFLATEDKYVEVREVIP
ncbi:MAG: pyridoxamine 5'-phosphate oxidase family protein [Desulfobacca sp.]|uniref:pyridoxamine 5'-phosphate oxidase family protein n=1 Tax=Desulfobacca sp. TaxID=2067990 RepID=UPI00404B5182